MPVSCTRVTVPMPFEPVWKSSAAFCFLPLPNMVRVLTACGWARHSPVVQRTPTLFGEDVPMVATPAVSHDVHLRGSAYEFNNTNVLLTGASIRVVEYPKLRARVGNDGTYSLAVPDRARVTPYI